MSPFPPSQTYSHIWSSVMWFEWSVRLTLGVSHLLWWQIFRKSISRNYTSFPVKNYPWKYRNFIYLELIAIMEALKFHSARKISWHVTDIILLIKWNFTDWKAFSLNFSQYLLRCSYTLLMLRTTNNCKRNVHWNGGLK